MWSLPPPPGLPPVTSVDAAAAGEDQELLAGPDRVRQPPGGDDGLGDGTPGGRVERPEGRTDRGGGGVIVVTWGAEQTGGLREDPTVVGTGSEVLVWGGDASYEGFAPRADGVLVHPGRAP